MASAAQAVHDAGVLLFGEHWVRKTAALLGLNPRTLQRVARDAHSGGDSQASQTAARLMSGTLRAALDALDYDEATRV